MFNCYDDFKNFIGQRIGELRDKKGVSARDMSLSIGKGEGYINNIENKNSMPSLEAFYYILEYFKVSPSDFFDSALKSPTLLADINSLLKKMDPKMLEQLFNFLKLLIK